jgi:hypothetical protein
MCRLYIGAPTAIFVVRAAPLSTYSSTKALLCGPHSSHLALACPAANSTQPFPQAQSPAAPYSQQQQQQSYAPAAGLSPGVGLSAAAAAAAGTPSTPAGAGEEIAFAIPAKAKRDTLAMSCGKVRGKKPSSRSSTTSWQHYFMHCRKTGCRWRPCTPGAMIA